LINECAAFSKVKKEQQLALGDIPLKIFRALDCCKNRQYIPNGWACNMRFTLGWDF
jgi:hypothetical protein